MTSTIEPFRIALPQQRLDWIADRIREYPWHALADAGGWSAGTDIGTLRGLAEHWLDGYNWRAQEARLNRYPQFQAAIDEQKVHFYHIRGRGRVNQPLLLLHGWPGSVHEFDAVIEPLTTPDAAGRAFDLVIAALPGYGFSQRLMKPIGPRAVADLMAALMRLLGYDSYIAQGGDWGAMIATQLAMRDAPRCKAIHINMVVPGTAAPETTEERAWAERATRIAAAETGYSRLQMTRPQTLAFAMTDSPVGTAAWILEKFALWSDLPRDEEGAPDLYARYSRDQLLTNIMFYVGPESFATASWLYHGVFHDPAEMPFAGGRHCGTPTAVAAFPDPVFAAPPRSLAEKSYAIVRWTDMSRGGHFAAMEAPEAFAADVRAFAEQIG